MTATTVLTEIPVRIRWSVSGSTREHMAIENVLERLQPGASDEEISAALERAIDEFTQEVGIDVDPIYVDIDEARVDRDELEGVMAELRRAVDEMGDETRDGRSIIRPTRGQLDIFGNEVE